MSKPATDTILLDVFVTNQLRERLIATAVEGTELPAEDYPMYVLVGSEGPLTPTGLAERTQMPLSTVLFRLRRLEKRGHLERIPNPDDRRSYLVRLTPAGEAAAGGCQAAFSCARGERGSGSWREDGRRAARRPVRSAAGDRNRDRLAPRRGRRESV